MSEGYGLGRRAFEFQYRQVFVRVDSDELGRVGAAIRKTHRERVTAPHHMKIGDDVSVVIPDEATSGALADLPGRAIEATSLPLGAGDEDDRIGGRAEDIDGIALVFEQGVGTRRCSDRCTRRGSAEGWFTTGRKVYQQERENQQPAVPARPKRGQKPQGTCKRLRFPMGRMGRMDSQFRLPILEFVERHDNITEPLPPHFLVD